MRDLTLCGRRALAVVLTCAVVGCSSVPSEISVSEGEKPLMTLKAHGVQVYECRPVAGGLAAWTLVAPQADLFDTTGRLIGHHGAGPTWQHVDGSSFTGAISARVDAPQTSAIPWLLMSARPQSTAGTFGRVSHVQRIDTVAGLPPDDGCSAATLGARAHMAYRAHYLLYVPRA